MVADELLIDAVRRSREKKADTPYPGDSTYDHMHQMTKYDNPDADVYWGGFWASEDRRGYTDMQGPDNWYNEGGHGDS